MKPVPVDYKYKANLRGPKGKNRCSLYVRAGGTFFISKMAVALMEINDKTGLALYADGKDLYLAKSAAGPCFVSINENHQYMLYCSGWARAVLAKGQFKQVFLLKKTQDNLYKLTLA